MDEAQAVEIVRHAVESGVDFIDTSRRYTTSEMRIGKALKQTDKPVVLASKSKGQTSADIRADLETSLKTLQKDYIDRYQCHNPKAGEYSKIISKGGAIEGLIRAKEEGLIGHIGITGHSLDLLTQILDDDLFDTIMVCFSFIESEALENVIPRALKNNIGVIAMKPLSGGVIGNPKPALKYALSQEDVLVLCGVESKSLFDENWKTFNGSYALTETEQKEIDAIRKEYDKNFCRRCDYCQPCTEGIPIQMVLGVRSQVKRMGKEILTRQPRAGVLEKARNCSECGECMTRCPYDLPIPDLIKENLQWVDNILKFM